VIGVRMRDDHRVHLSGRQKSLQRARCSWTKVKQQPEAAVLDQVARAR
jgi:hypothetical protein